ncbi:MAG TPA: hypothetical protein ENJ60_07130 [Aeromonadales bacterium]|nr:hypothetical protein [Aeromonadales bacterium]
MKTLSKIIFISFVMFTITPAMAKKPTTTPAVQQAAEKVSLNNGDAQTLATVLKGVGLKRAEAIVSYRKDHGPFKAIEDLANVKGIGVATVEKNRARISL